MKMYINRTMENLLNIARKTRFDFPTEKIILLGGLLNASAVKKELKQLGINIVDIPAVGFVDFLKHLNNDTIVLTSPYGCDHDTLSTLKKEHFRFFETLSKNVNTNKKIRIYYAFSIEEAQEIKNRIEEKYNQIIDGARQEATDFKKIKYVHNKLIEISKYQEPLENSTQELQTIISIFDTGYSVCAGYTNGFKFIMDNLDIKSMSMQSVGNEDKKRNHIWNMVNLYGKWYNLDVTWDSQKTENEEISYDYFLKDNDEFYTDHRMQEGMPVNS